MKYQVAEKGYEPSEMRPDGLNSSLTRLRREKKRKPPYRRCWNRRKKMDMMIA